MAGNEARETQQNKSCALWDALAHRKISDHAPLSVSFKGTEPIAFSSRPIPKFVASSPRFAVLVSDHIMCHECATMSSGERLQLHKRAIRVVSRVIVRDSLARSWENPCHKALLLSMTARAVVRNDIGLFAKCAKDCSKLKEFVELARVTVTGHDAISQVVESRTSCFVNRLHFSDHSSFAQELSSLRRVEWDSARDKLCSPKHSPAVRAKIDNRIVEWAKTGRRLQVGGICLGDGAVTRDISEMSQALAQHWSTQFLARDVSDSRLSQFFKSNVVDLSDVAPLTPKTMQYCLRRRSDTHSSPGPDGIPYQMWCSTPLETCRTLRLVFFDMCYASEASENFNISWTACPPKKVVESELANPILRAPQNTRPISGKNTDNKLIADSINLAWSETIHARAHRAQPGFIFSRNFLDNVLGADTLTRIASMGDPHISTCLASYDFGSAFVSLSHAYLFAVLRAGHAPLGLLNVLTALYLGCMSYILGSDPAKD